MKHLFYHTDLAPAEISLTEEEAHHARSVLRLGVGERIGLVDGKGTKAEAEVAVLDKRQLIVRVISRALFPAERSARIHLAVAPTKQIDRFEWMIEKCTEIGVDRITPLITERTERSTLRRDRLERVIVSAMKQSQRAWLPQLDEAMTLNDLISGTIPAQRSFGWCEGEHAPFTRTYNAASDALMLIGPEGDFTADEAQVLRQKDFSAVSLGAARLRTETAAVAACTWMSLAQLL